MLHNLRAASNTWTGKILSALLMGLIVLAFSIFGIADFFRGFGATKLASVGDAEISSESFRQAWQTQLQRLSAQTKRNITNDEARRAGLDTQLLNQLVNDAVIDQRAHGLGLAMSDAAITSATQQDRAFAGIGGTFDKNRFADVLRQNNLSERGYIEEQRRIGLRQQLAEALGGEIKTPRAMLEVFNRTRNERRSLDYVVLPVASAGDIPAPSEEELTKYFSLRAENFRSPEYRKLVVLAVRPEALANPDAMSDADAMKRYDDTKAARYTSPEKRSVQQISFPTEAEAAEASAKIKAGSSFDAIALERKLTEKDISLGTVEKGKLIGDIDKVAFELPVGTVSEPVKNLFGSVLVRVTAIMPASVKPFADVAQDIKRELSLLEARKQAQILHDKVEDARTGGKPLAEAAKAAGLEARMIEAIDASGRDKLGAPVADLGDPQALLRAAFASDIGVDNDTIQTRDKGTLWFEVAAIEPARPQTLEEVKPRVAQAWRDDETARRLAAKASDMVKKLDAGTPMAEIAKSEGDLEVRHVGDAQRKGQADLPPGVVASVFNVGVGGAGSGAAPGGRLVFKVLDSVVPPLDMDAAETKSLDQELRSAIGNDIFAQYAAQLQGEAGVKINAAILRQVTGAEAN